jgi:hypothetical protein
MKIFKRRDFVQIKMRSDDEASWTNALYIDRLKDYHSVRMVDGAVVAIKDDNDIRRAFNDSSNV